MKCPGAESKPSASQASVLNRTTLSVLFSGLSNKHVWMRAQSYVPLHQEGCGALPLPWYSFAKGTETESGRSTSKVSEEKLKVSHWLSPL